MHKFIKHISPQQTVRCHNNVHETLPTYLEISFRRKHYDLNTHIEGSDIGGAHFPKETDIPLTTCLF